MEGGELVRALKRGHVSSQPGEPAVDTVGIQGMHGSDAPEVVTNSGYRVVSVVKHSLHGDDLSGEIQCESRLEQLADACGAVIEVLSAGRLRQVVLRSLVPE